MGEADRASKLTELDADREGLWDAKDVATFLKVSRSWVYHRAEAGLIPCLRVGSLLRFERDAIRRLARGGWKSPNLIDLPKKST